MKYHRLYHECVWWKNKTMNNLFFLWYWPDPTCVFWKGPFGGKENRMTRCNMSFKLFDCGGRSTRQRPCAQPPHWVQTLLWQKERRTTSYDPAWKQICDLGLKTQVLSMLMEYSISYSEAIKLLYILYKRDKELRLLSEKLKILWSYWALSWVPVPQNTSWICSRIQAYVIPADVFVPSRTQSVYRCSNIINFP